MQCKYKAIFGNENTGIHAIRLFNTAFIDILGTILIALIISYIFNYNVYIVFIILMIIAIILHRLFCVNTTINKHIFGIV